MRFTDLRDDTLPTGRLCIWVPTAEARARAERAPRDLRRTSHNQEGHLTRALASRVDPGLLGAVEDPTGTDGRAVPTGWLAVRFDVASCGEPALGRSLERWIGRHETLRSGFRAETSGTEVLEIERFTLAADDVTLESVDLGEHRDAVALGERLEDLFNACTDPVGWPAYVFASIRSEHSTSLILAFNHLNVDGYSLLLVAHEVRELVAAEVEDRAPRLPLVPSYIDFVEAERERAAQGMSSGAEVSRWTEFLEPAHEAPVFPLRDGLSPGSQVPQGSCCLPILSEPEAAGFGRWCRLRGVSAGTGFLAAFSLACHQLADEGRAPVDPSDPGDHRLRVLVSTHTRDEPHWALAMGWFTAVAPFHVDLPRGATLGEVLPAVAEAWGRARQGAALPLDRVGELLGHPVAPRFVVSYLDARHTPGSSDWEAWRAHAYLGDVGPTDEVYAWINRMPTETYLTWRYPDNEVCRREVDAVTERVQQIVLAATTSGGSTAEPPEEVRPTW